MTQFNLKSRNFIILMVVALTLLIGDLFLLLADQPTFSESIWEVNQHTLALAFGVGMVCGHLFTVPKDDVRQ
jgi:hypothetical protein